MKAAILHGPQSITINEIPIPEIHDDEVLLKIRTIGICGTDLHLFQRGNDKPEGIILGHEFAAEVTKVGKNVTAYAVGQRVVAEHVLGCGLCEFCQSQRKNLCINPAVYGINVNGAMAEYMAIPASLLFPIPDTMSYEQATVVEPLSIALYAVQKAQLQAGMNVAVIGQGSIGILIDKVLKTKNVHVYGIDIEQEKLNYVKKHKLIKEGYIADISLPEIQKEFEHEWNGFDCVFEAVGRPETINLSLQLTKKGGQIIIVGLYEKPFEVDMIQILKRELTVKGSWTCLNTFQTAINLLSTGEITSGDFITRTLPFDKLHAAFKKEGQPTVNIKTILALP